MSGRYDKSIALSARAAGVIAGGVVSLNRKTDPAIVFAKALGSQLWDTDGNQYIDYHAAFAPHLLGHNDPEVNAAVVKAMSDGWSLMGSGTTSWELQLAELLRDAVPSLQSLQITNTGSEATALAIRLSRAFTGRDHIVLTLGGYNGWHNDVARQVMPSVQQMGPRVSAGEYKFMSASAGIPGAVTGCIHLINFNDPESLEHVLKRYPVACVLTEPALQNIGVVPPRSGYLQTVRNLCDAHGTVLVFDEVKTGFRSALGGYQSIAKVTPDLSVFGKAVANGYPLGVIGGKPEIMKLFHTDDASKRVLIAGTYNAHPFNVAASIATLGRLKRNGGEVYRQLESRSSHLQAGLEKLFIEKGMTATISRIGSAFCAYFFDHVPFDWHDVAAHHDFAFDQRYRRGLIDNGVYYFPAPCKQGSVSAAHTEEDIAKTLEVTRDVLKSL